MGDRPHGPAHALAHPDAELATARAAAAAVEAGVAKVCALLAEELRRTMALLGAPTLADLRPEMVVLPGE